MKGAVAQAGDVRLLGADADEHDGLRDFDALEELRRLVSVEHQRFAYLDDVLRLAHWMGGFTSMMWLVTSQSKSILSAARCCLNEGGASSPAAPSRKRPS
jgi:hypothetical protein